MKTLVAVVLLVAPLAQASLFEGDWRTDVPAEFKLSSIGSVPSGLTFAVTSDKVTITDRVVFTDGHSRASDNIFQTDGKPHPSSNGTDWFTVAKCSNPYLLEIVETGIGERTVTVHATYSLSADRKTLTRRIVYSWNGHIDERVFYR